MGGQSGEGEGGSGGDVGFVGVAKRRVRQKAQITQRNTVSEMRNH